MIKFLSRPTIISGLNMPIICHLWILIILFRIFYHYKLYIKKDGMKIFWKRVKSILTDNL